MKKVTSLLLVLVLVLGMSVTSFASIKVKTDETTGAGFSTAKNGAVSGPEVDLGDVTPGDSAKFKLISNGTGKAFDLDMSKATTQEATAAAQASNGLATEGYVKKALPKVVARTRISKGANAIDKAEINFGATGDVAQIELKFVNPFKNNNVDGQEFDIWLFPVVDGKTWNYKEKGINFKGVLKNDTVPVDAQTSYVDLYTGYIAEITETVRKVEFDLGSDVIIIGKGHKGAKYWGRAHQDVSETDSDNMDKHNIDAVYHLEVLGGLDKGANNVEIRSAGKKDYIFDGNMKFLGMGDSKTIPYSETYYIADHMIEIEAEAEPIENADNAEQADPLVVPPETGATASAPQGLFQNPSTGA